MPLGQAREGRRVGDGVKLVARQAKARVGRDARQKIVFAPELLDLGRRGDAMLPDRLVQALAVAALFAHAVHQDVLRCHKGQLLAQMLFHDGGVDLHAARDVDDQVQHRVGAEEGLRDAQAAVGRIVQRPLKPLGRGRDGGVLHVADQIPRKRADPLGAHRVALVGHGRGADLMAFEGLVDLLEVA